MGFQTRVNSQPAPAVAGDFASTNPRASVTAPDNGYTAAPNYPATFGGALREALIVGRFAWANYATGLMANYITPNALLGFVHRENQTIITTFLGEQRLGVQQGFPAVAQSQGDYWADFAASAPDAAGLVVYANPLTGVATADVTGNSVTVTGFTGALVAATGVLTVSGSGSGSFAVGQVITGTGIPDGTYIVSLGSGSGGTGTYNLNQGAATNLSGVAITGWGVQETRFKLATPVAGTVSFTGVIDAFNKLTASAVSGGSLSRGQTLHGTGVAVNTTIVCQLSGTPGGAGTYEVNNAVAVTSTAMTATAGTLGKISSWQA